MEDPPTTFECILEALSSLTWDELFELRSAISEEIESRPAPTED